MKAKPQVVFMDMGNAKGIQQVTNLGITAVGVKFRHDSISDCVDYMIWLGNLFGGDAPQKAADYKSFVDKNLETLHSEVSDIPVEQRPTVLLIYFEGKSYMSIAAMEGIKVAGGRPIMDSPSGRLISKEQLICWNPDVIFLHTPTQSAFDDFKNDKALATLKAVKNGKVYSFATDGGIGNILQSLYMAKLLYPEKFSQLNLNDEIVFFYQTMYEITPSADDLNTFFTGY